MSFRQNDTRERRFGGDLVEDRSWDDKPKLPSMTKQSDADSVDINVILAGYQATGQLPDAARIGLGQYGDVSEIGSFAECVQRVKDAQEAFMALPARVRDRYANDPVELLAAIDAARNGDPDSFDELVKLGLAELRPTSSAPSSSPGTAPAGAPAPEAPAAGAGGAPAPKA